MKKTLISQERFQDLLSNAKKGLHQELTHLRSQCSETFLKGAGGSKPVKDQNDLKLFVCLSRVDSAILSYS